MKIEAVTAETQKYIDPLATLQSKFPTKEICNECRATIALEDLYDLHYKPAKQYYHGDSLRWRCPICKTSNTFVWDSLLIKAWVEFDKESNVEVKDGKVQTSRYTPFLAGIVVVLLIILFLAVLFI